MIVRCAAVGVFHCCWLSKSIRVPDCGAALCWTHMHTQSLLVACRDVWNLLVDGNRQCLNQSVFVLFRLPPPPPPLTLVPFWLANTFAGQYTLTVIISDSTSGCSVLWELDDCLVFILVSSDELRASIAAVGSSAHRPKTAHFLFRFHFVSLSLWTHFITFFGSVWCGSIIICSNGFVGWVVIGFAGVPLWCRVISTLGIQLPWKRVNLKFFN